MNNGAVPVVMSWGDAIMISFTRAFGDFMAFIPKFLGALVILLVGWLISSLVASLVTRGLRMVRFNQIADRAEIDQFLARAGVRMDPAAVVGKMAFWFLMLSFLIAAFGALGLSQVEGVLANIVGFIPNVIVAVVVLLIGALVANFVANLVRGSSGMARVGDPNLLANIARGTVLVFAAMMALDQLEIAPTILNTLWTALIGMVAVAGALAFGLGGRDIAHRILEDWYEKGKQKANQVSSTQYSAPTPTPMPAERRAA
ncbi:MAG TPA: small-conductance mechanosensitive ion channel [Chloroflexota bacterium]|nr:small-conductance mechanosensitive ion channel [Chloroflexota bacterium]